MVRLNLQFFGGRGAGSSGGAGSGKRRTQAAHLDEWKEPPSLADQLASRNGISHEEAVKQIESVKAYCGWQYGNIRDAQYNDRVSTPEYKQAQAIEDFIAQSPVWAGGELYRGIALPNASVKHLKVGSRVDMRGMSSWSTEASIADNFAKTWKSNESAVVFRTKGTKKGTSVTHLSKYNHEKEVLVSGKATWTIKKITKQGKQIYIDVEED